MIIHAKSHNEQIGTLAISCSSVLVSGFGSVARLGYQCLPVPVDCQYLLSIGQKLAIWIQN